jgi:hypothetical protein
VGHPKLLEKAKNPERPVDLVCATIALGLFSYFKAHTTLSLIIFYKNSIKTRNTPKLKIWAALISSGFVGQYDRSKTSWEMMRYIKV